MEREITGQPSWAIQKNVLFALFIRELKNRFGLFRLGYIWAIAEPVAFIGVLSVIRQAFGTQPISGVAYPLFFASGILPYLYFQTSVTQSLTAIEGNLALLTYKAVKPSDGVIAKCLVEIVIYTVTGIAIIAVMANFWFPFRIENALGVIAVIICLVLLTLGISFITAVLGPLHHESKKVVPILMRPLFFLSGVFFAADSLPHHAREILLYNPLMQIMELLRHYLFASYQSNEGSLPYLFLCSLLSFFFGLSYYRNNRIRLATSGQIR